MRIYLADIYHSTRCGMAQFTKSQSMHLRVTTMCRYPFLLESYFYTTEDMVKALRLAKDTLFLDSGAFSMFTRNVKVDLRAYSDFIKKHKDVIHIASNLDAIGQAQEEVSYTRQKELEDYGVKIQPVFHARDKDEWLVRYLEEGYDYIFLGGMVPESTVYLKEWLDRIWHKYLTNPDGTAKVKVHGFGLTSLPLMFRYPWFSVDSTSWVMTSVHGSCFMDLPQLDGTTKDVKLDFSDRSKAKEKINSWHFDTLTKAEQGMVRSRLEIMEQARPKFPELEAELEKEMGCRQGFYPEALAKSYGWRDYANIEYFRRAMDRKVDRFVREQETLW